MTAAAVLLGYAAAAGTMGAKALARARWLDRAPLLAAITYLAAAWSAVAAAGLAGLTLAVHATALGGALSQLIGACVIRLRDTYATPGGAAVAGAGLVLASLIAARVTLTAARQLRTARRLARQHAQTARLIGRLDPAMGAVLVEHPQPMAYCVAGRQPTVIVTSGALRALDPGQVEAVLAHERAHLTWHHHQLLALARISHRALPFVPLMRAAEAQVQRLVEMHADDTATQMRDPRSLASALVVLATAAAAAPAQSGTAQSGTAQPGTPPSATSVLGSVATDAAHRIGRLLRPAEPLRGSRRLLLRTVTAALVLGPPAIALIPALLALALGRVPHA